MVKNEQLTFPFEPKTYLSPYDDDYSDKIKLLDLGDYGERVDVTRQRLLDAGDAISSIFSWDCTVEGMYFWSHAADALYAMVDELERRHNLDDVNEERTLVDVRHNDNALILDLDNPSVPDPWVGDVHISDFDDNEE